MRKPVRNSIRKKILSDQSQNCADCGERFKTSINIHHIDGDNSNNDLNNLVGLCHNCHDERHNKEFIKKATKKEIKEEEYPLDLIKMSKEDVKKFKELTSYDEDFFKGAIT